MTANLPPYSSYRPSGMSWLDQVPAHWDVKRNGQLFSQRKETGFTELPILEVSLRTGVRVRRFDAAARKQVMSDRSKYKRAAKGDIAYNMMRMWQGAVGVAPEDGLISPAYVVASPFAGVEPRYFSELFRTAAYMGEVDAHSHGIVKDRNRLYWEDFKQIFSVFPPSIEQQAIVRFIGHLDRLAARYLQAKQKLIMLLEEQRRAIIYQAVTRGQDETVRLRPSGVEWLGDVPEHWKVLQLRRVAFARCDGPFGSGLTSAHYTQHGVRVIRLQNIGAAEFKDEDKAYISPLHYASLGDHSVMRGDLLIAGLGDERHPAGRACVAPTGIEPAMVKADCFRFRLDSSQVDPFFVALQLTATAIVASAILSTGATRQRINLTSAAYRAIAFPPLAEQNAVIESIRKDTAALTANIKMLRSEISLMREYRTRLITDVVTGQLDVREAAFSLQDEDGEPGEMSLTGDILEEASEADLGMDDLIEEVAE